jgi:NADPH:quinone reductase-like Zn-dependent oxidoreductase
VCERYGPPEVVTIREVADPVPSERDVLIQSVATTCNSGDARMRALRVPRGLGVPVRLSLGLTKPRRPIFGFDVAGHVAAIGSAVTRFQPGDRVVASRGFAFGCHAEYVTVAEDGAIARIPAALNEQEAVALCFGGSTALTFFRLGRLVAGESVLINGASGAVGVMAIQLAKHTGAEVTAVCSAANARLVRSLGADHVVDYRSQDFAGGGRRYDVIMDNHGNAPYPRVKGLLRPGGRYLMVIGDLPQMLAASQRRDVVTTSRNEALFSAESLGKLMSLAAEGTLRPVIDSVFAFEEIVEAHRRVDSGHKVGSVVVAFSAA